MKTIVPRIDDTDDNTSITAFTEEPRETDCCSCQTEVLIPMEDMVGGKCLGQVTDLTPAPPLPTHKDNLILYLQALH